MRKLVLLSLLLLVACSGGGDPVSTEDAAPDISSDATADGATDVLEPDDSTPDTAPDGSIDAAPDMLLPECDPGEGCFLDPCAENVDCQSGWCVEHMGDGVCTKTCQDDCPSGWS